jgi:hypothetical protein
MAKTKEHSNRKIKKQPESRPVERLWAVVDVLARKVVDVDRTPDSLAGYAGGILVIVATAAKLPPANCARFIALVGTRTRAERREEDDFDRSVRRVQNPLIEMLELGQIGDPISIGDSYFKFRLLITDERAKALSWVKGYLSVGNREGAEGLSNVGRERIGVLQHAMEEIIVGLPADYDARRDALAGLTDAFRERIARALEPVLNEHLAKEPQSKYDEKKSLSTYVNAELRRFGLAIRCPRTDEPCLLRANPGRQTEQGRFQLEYTDAQGKRHQPQSSSTLPHLELMLDDLTRAPYGERSQRRR